jgi:uncharacterized repeat protein (TIGR03803 family)
VRTCNLIRSAIGIGLAGFVLSACGERQVPLELPDLVPQSAISAKRTERVLYSFHGRPDGGNPFWGVIAGEPGTFYGTTDTGGINGLGTIFQLTRVGKHYRETILRNCGYGDVGPQGSLVRDASGNLYGTTIEGGHLGSCATGVGCGTVFELSPSTSGYTETLLWRFAGAPDGAYPIGGVVRDKNGALYGVAQLGGAYNAGIVFKLTPASSGYSETILHSFGAGHDGVEPEGRLAADAAGAFYGGTNDGGVRNNGVVFKLTPSSSGYTESILHTFHDRNDGKFPIYGLTVDTSGVVFGMANGGCCGEVFELLPSGASYRERTIYDFKGGTDGAWPAGPLLDVHGVLYGETSDGGGSSSGRGQGTAFELSAAGKSYRERVLYRFSGGSDGKFPEGGFLIRGHRLYGTTDEGGTYPLGGTVFEVALP